jgi:O-antigen/teichoic acid export membrane protein
MLSKNQIRVQYSGFIIFAAQILSLITGIVFTLLLTRISTKDAAEFGAWSFIFYLVGLFTLLSGVFPFWATRFVARGKEGAIKTGVSANIIFALVAAAIYLPLAAPVMNAFHISNAYLFIYLLAAVQIVNTFLIATFEGCLRSVKPQVIGYGLLIEEIVKVTLAYALVIGLGQLLLGAMISLIMAALVQAIFYSWLLKGELRQAMKWNYLKEWLKSSPVMIYNAVGTQLTGLFLYLLVFFAGQGALGNYQAAVTFSTVIGYSSSITFALYPKMLAGECATDVATSLKTMLMFALPIAAVAFIMPRSLLTILNTSYAPAAPILMLLAVDTLVVLVSQFYNQYLLGVETFDVEGKISLRQLLRSKIFKVFTLPYIQAAISLPSVYIILTQFVLGNPVQAAMYVVAVNIVVHTVTFIALYGLMRKSVNIPVAWKSIGKYGIGALLTAGILFILPQTTTLAATFGKVLIGLAAYAALLYAIDADARKLAAQIWSEIKEPFKR